MKTLIDELKGVKEKKHVVPSIEYDCKKEDKEDEVLTVACGIATLALQNYSSIIWIKTKTILSMTLTIISVVIFIASLQPYVAFFTFVLLIIKGALLLKRP